MIGLRRIVEAVQEAAQEYGIDRLAAEFDRKQSSIYSELNYHLNTEKKAKLGLLDAVRIMRLSGNHRGLHAIAAALGYTVQRIEATPTPAQPLKHVAAMNAVVQFLQADEAGEDYTRLHGHLETATHALESIWVARRAEHVSFSIREVDAQEAERPEPKRRWWSWRRA